MECLSGCGHGGNGQCTRDQGCARVDAMATCILENIPTTLADVAHAGGITPKQWPGFKSFVENKLNVNIGYENLCLPGGSPRERHLTTFRR